VYDGNKVSGPYTEEAIAENLRRGFSPTILVRRKGTTNWHPINEHAPFAFAAQQASRSSSHPNYQAAPSPTRKKSSWAEAIAGIVGTLVVGAIAIYFISVLFHRRPPNPLSALSGPETLVSETISLKEGNAMSYPVYLPSPREVRVTVSASPEAVDVMLMSQSEWERFREVKGNLFGGRYTYRRALSRKSILSMEETDTLPAGAWRIVVERPSESLLFTESTAATVKILAY
jgi:hypothetical protein